MPIAILTTGTQTFCWPRTSPRQPERPSAPASATTLLKPQPNAANDIDDLTRLLSGSSNDFLHREVARGLAQSLVDLQRIRTVGEQILHELREFATASRLCTRERQIDWTASGATGNGPLRSIARPCLPSTSTRRSGTRRNLG